MAAVIDELFSRVGAWHADPIPEGQVRYLTTGFRDLNQLTGGLRPGLYLCGARPSVGKTSLWSQIAVNAARALAQAHVAPPAVRDGTRAPGHTAGGPDGPAQSVLYFTNEMTPLQLATRLCCSAADAPILEMESGRLDRDQLARVNDALAAMEHLPLRLVYARTLSAIVSRCYQGEPPALIVVDYLNKLSGGVGENRNQEFGYIASALFDVAYDLQAPVVLLCQLNRDLRKRGRLALPEMEDLRDSGELEQIADVVLLLHRTSDAPSALSVLKRKDRLGGGQHQRVTLSFGPVGHIDNRPSYDEET